MAKTEVLRRVEEFRRRTGRDPRNGHRLPENPRPKPKQPEEKERLCRICHHVRPIEEFRRDHPYSGRKHQCRECHAAYERARRARTGPDEEKRKAEQAAAHERKRLALLSFVNAIASSKGPNQRIAELLEGMIEKTGGPDALAARWTEELEKADPGDPIYSASILAMFRVLEYLEKERS